MVLVLDNYDSFTYNLVQYLKSWGSHRRPKRRGYRAVDRRRQGGSHRDLSGTRAS